MLVAEIPILLHRLVDDAFQFKWQVRIQSRWRWERSIKNRIEDHSRGVATKLQGPCGHFIEHGPKGEQVGARVQFLAAHLLRRRIGNRADGASGTRQHLLVDTPRFPFGSRRNHREFRQSEIQHLGVTLRSHENIGRFDVAVHDPFSVRRIEGVGDLNGQLQQYPKFHWAPGDAISQRCSVQELHDDEVPAVMPANFVNGADVGVVQRRGGARLPAKALQRLWIARHFVRQKLQRHEAAKISIFRFVDDPHTAAAQLFDDAVVRDDLADHVAKSYVSPPSKSMNSPDSFPVIEFVYNGTAKFDSEASLMRSLHGFFLLLVCVVIFFVPVPSVGQNNSLHGIDLGDLDRKAAPCDDFYEFANGTWRANNPIPASMERWSKRWQAGESAKDKLHVILEAAVADKTATKGSNEQIIGDYYGACMDESKINARGMDPIKPWFAKIDAARDIASLQQVMADLHDIIVNAPFAFGSQQDPHKPSWVLADVGASGLSLPDRDYYLKPEPRFKEAREKYVEHVTKMLTMAGWGQKSAAAGSQTIMTMETKLAEASLDNVALRDPSATDHNTTFAQLQALAPHFDWTAYFQHKQS